MLCLAVNYGARMEIADAVRSICRQVQNGTLDPEQVTEATVASHLMTDGMPDPDLVIRTASEMRISNFLLWQISYSELWVTDCYWPEFREPQLHDALRSYASRDRRFGGLNQQPADVSPAGA
jgi:undecaprenyl diphosphate synthase